MTFRKGHFQSVSERELQIVAAVTSTAGVGNAITDAGLVRVEMGDFR